MPPRSSWKGFIRLSLVSVPVKAYTASATGSEIRLNQLHKDCHSRIKYKKSCPTHGEVTNEDIVSGYEYAKGQYVVVDPSELEKLRPKSDKAVNVHGFVEWDALDPMYHAGRTYYLLPDGPIGQKPYALLHRGMEEGELCAIAEIVLAGKEQLVMLRPLEQMIAMTILYHDDRLKRPETFDDELTEVKSTKEEFQLTKTLIQASMLKDFDFENYRDSYVDKLTEVIQAKVDGKEIVEVPDVEEPKIINLMEALKESVAKLQDAPKKKAASGSNTKSKSKTKMAPSAKKKAASRKRKSG